jgi:hypothetical protein
MSSESKVKAEDLAAGQVWDRPDGFRLEITGLRSGRAAYWLYYQDGSHLVATSSSLAGFAERAKRLLSIDGKAPVHRYHDCLAIDLSRSWLPPDDQTVITCPVCIRLAREAAEVECEWCEGGDGNCPSKHEGLYCTRQRGHEGPHVACDGHPRGHSISRWPQEPEPDEVIYQVLQDSGRIKVQFEDSLGHEWGVPGKIHNGRTFTGWLYPNGDVRAYGPVAWEGAAGINRQITVVADPAEIVNAEGRPVIAVEAIYTRLDIAKAQSKRGAGE